MHPNLILLVPAVAVVYFQFALESQFNYYHDYFSSLFESDISTTFDFIIVGGGSAGSILANRLSRHNRVLLLEAGGDPLQFQRLPSLATAFIHRPQVDWMYQTQVQQNSHFGQTKPGVSNWPRGLGLGGSSNLNYMIYVRGHPQDYNHWAELIGDESWRYENLLKYFKKSLHYNGKYSFNEGHYKGDGSLHVEGKPIEETPLLPYFLEAGKELGYEAVNDLNGPQRTGFGSIEYTQKDGARCGTFDAFLRPILNRPNLTILRYSRAIKIKFDKSNRAEGVWYERHWKTKFLKFRRELILSAGAIETPKLLMLSSIGPSAHLRSLNITPRVNLPVGQNLQDHLFTVLPPVVLNTAGSNVTFWYPDRDFNIKTFYDYLVHGTGPFSVPIPFNGQAFISTSKTKNVDWPNIQIFVINVGAYSFVSYDLSKFFGQQQDQLEAIWGPVQGQPVMLLGIVLVRPQSSGNIRLKNNNPNTPPLIDPKYLQKKDDLAAIIESIEILVNMTENTNSFERLEAKFGRTPIPACAGFKVMTSKYWECYVKNLAVTLYHPTGTCKMGQGVNDPSAVLDSSFRVLQTGALRVVDASAMPTIVNGNTNAPVIMMAEKASDLIRQFWADQFLICPAHFLNRIKRNLKLCYYSQLV